MTVVENCTVAQRWVRKLAKKQAVEIGSIGLLDLRTGEFFSGDAIYEGGLVDDLPECDIEAYEITMKRLSELDVDVVHGGHGAMFGRDRLREIALSYLVSKEA